MPRNGSGSYSLPQAAFVPGTTISSSAVNSDLSDIASALTGSVAADGQTPLSGGIKATDGSAGAPSYTFNSSLTDGFFLSGTHTIGIAIAGTLIGEIGAAGILTTAGAPATIPVGSVNDFAGSAAPSGWLLCYGQAVSRTTYAALLSVIGTTYGVGDNSTTFNLPDCRGRFGAGRDDMGGVAANRITAAGGNFDGTVLGGAGGQQNETLTTAQMPAHNHTINVTDPGHTHTVTGIGGATGGNELPIGPSSIEERTVPTSSSTTGVTAVSVNTGGGAAHPVLSPAIIFNKIIFAGA